MTTLQHNKVLDLLASVMDPEIPVLSVMDMGVVRSVEETESGWLVKITPTYSGCPAMDTIASDIQKTLEDAGYRVKVEQVLSPAWTTDWMTEKGKQKLKEYGIAAPLEEGLDKRALMGEQKLVPCPHCGSTRTQVSSAFGSTACKALFVCQDCLEPFDYFKCLK